MKKLSLLYALGALLLTVAVHAQTFSVIHYFGGGGGGENPAAGVTLHNGTLYGTTENGGGYCSNFCGTAYQIVRSGSDWRLSPIYFFQGDNGDNPLSRVVVGPDGHLYGTTYKGGPDGGGGTVYNLIPQPVLCTNLRCFWKESVLFHPWNKYLDLNGLTYGDLAFDSQGNMYGVAEYGGPQNDGGVYQVSCSAQNCTGAPIYSFSGTDGKNPQGAVLVESNGNLMVAAYRGGKYDHGTIVELTYQQGVGWSKIYQYDFQAGSDGAGPFGGLISDGAGNLIGTTLGFGDNGGGTVFQLSPAGNSWMFTVLLALPPSCSSHAPVTRDSTGNLYGTCYYAANQGSVFKLSKAGNTWTYTSLHEFTGTDGAGPIGNVAIDADGTLYGTTAMGGNCPMNYYGCGTVWMIKP